MPNPECQSSIQTITELRTNTLREVAIQPYSNKDTTTESLPSDHLERRSQTSSKQAEIYRRLNLKNINPPSNNTFLEQPKSFSYETRQAYGFTNENLTAVMKDLNFEGKKVACIGGSGDFGINAVMNGAKSVDVVDISPVSCFLGELKIAGITQFSYEEYLRFFATTGSETFGPESFEHSQYQHLKPYISTEAEHFFKQLIKPEKNSEFLSPEGMIIQKVVDMNYLKRMNPYLESENNYNKAKDTLKRVEILFYPQDIRNFLKNNKNSQYGIIHLSNIFCYPPYVINETARYLNLPEVDLTIEYAKDALAIDGEVSSYLYYQEPNTRAVNDDIQEIWKGEGGMEGREILGDTIYNIDFKFSNLVLKKIKPTNDMTYSA